MPITITWDNAEQTVLRWDYQGEWTWQELLDANEISYAMVAAQPHIVDIIVDMTHSPTLPSNTISLYRSLRHQIRTAENAGTTILIGCSPYVKAIIYTLSRIPRLYIHQFSVADSLAEARAILA